ncbi:MAG: hypothetical protein ACKVHR_20255, partial [Pirellulales bacterium]
TYLLEIIARCHLFVAQHGPLSDQLLSATTLAIRFDLPKLLHKRPARAISFFHKVKTLMCQFPLDRHGERPLSGSRMSRLLSNHDRYRDRKRLDLRA